MIFFCLHGICRMSQPYFPPPISNAHFRQFLLQLKRNCEFKGVPFKWELILFNRGVFLFFIFLTSLKVFLYFGIGVVFRRAAFSVSWTLKLGSRGEGVQGKFSLKTGRGNHTNLLINNCFIGLFKNIVRYTFSLSIRSMIKKVSCLFSRNVI